MRYRNIPSAKRFRVLYPTKGDEIRNCNSPRESLTSSDETQFGSPYLAVKLTRVVGKELVHLSSHYSRSG
jgi:hypothetical protein